MQHEPHPESRDTLEAVEDVIHGGKRKKNFFEANILLLKEDSKNERTRKIIFDLLILIMIASALVLLWVGVIDPYLAKQKQDEFSGMIIGTTQPSGSEDNTPAGEDDEEDKSGGGATISFDDLLARNKDCVGFLNAPGANINLPIVQTANNDYYLKRDFDLRPSQYGNPFVDWRVVMNPLSTNLVIYGHHMRDGSIFSKLTNYRNVETVQKYPIITFQQPDGTTLQYKIFAVVDINGNAEDDNGYVFYVNTYEFKTKENFDGYIRQLKQRTYINTPVDVEYGDKLITLQTCVYDFRPEFLYVVGRLIRPGESSAVDSTQITKNKNPRLPQALYNKYKQTNPFKDAELWYPE